MFRHLPAAVLAATLTAGAFAAPAAAEPDRPGATQTQAMHRECEGETPYCTRRAKANKHARWYRAGRKGHSPRRFRYPRYIKRSIISEMIRESKPLRRNERKKAWNTFTDDDSCITYGFASEYEWDCRRGRLHFRKPGKVGVNVIKYSTGTWMALLSGGAHPLVGALSGPLQEPWYKFIKRLGR